VRITVTAAIDALGQSCPRVPSRQNMLTASIFALQAAQLFHEDGRTKE
jgi:hypothetical protein